MLDLPLELPLPRRESHLFQRRGGPEVLSDREGNLKLVPKEDRSPLKFEYGARVERHAVFVVAESAALTRHTSTPPTGDLDAVSESATRELSTAPSESTKSATRLLDCGVA